VEFLLEADRPDSPHCFGAVHKDPPEAKSAGPRPDDEGPSPWFSPEKVN
jgi:hypothetical protein